MSSNKADLTERILLGGLDGLARASIVGIGAHPDDLELGMPAFILPCVDSSVEQFAGVTCSDGVGSFRAKGFEHLTSEQFVRVRLEEQLAAARLGNYSAQVMLGHPEPSISDGSALSKMTDDIEEVLRIAEPHTVVTHSLTDRHIHHRRVALATIAACRRLARRPDALFGVEIWGGLEWLQPAAVKLPVADRTNLAERLASCHASQVGHTPYGEAAAARRFVNGTYALDRSIGVREDITYALDMTVLLWDPELSPALFLNSVLTSASDAVAARLALDLEAFR
jgi:LmbE family N-acetylglucosaminyl deacetylase